MNNVEISTLEESGSAVSRKFEVEFSEPVNGQWLADLIFKSLKSAPAVVNPPTPEMMKEYHKIQTVFKRDPENNHKTLLLGDYSIPEFEYLKNNIWVFTEKVDGTNIRIIWDGEQITFGGKTDNAQIPVFLVKYLNDKFLPLIADFRNIFSKADEVCLYGEGYGAKIQKGGGNYRSDQSFVLFDVKIGEWWLQRKDVEDIAQKLSLDIVPIVGEGTLEQMIHMVQSGELKSQWGDFLAEGIVARPQTELKTRSGQRIITKIKHRDFN